MSPWRPWGGDGHEGRVVRFNRGQFRGRVAILGRLSGDYFYYAEDPLNGERLHGYLSEMEFLPDNHFSASEAETEE